MRCVVLLPIVLVAASCGTPDQLGITCSESCELPDAGVVDADADANADADADLGDASVPDAPDPPPDPMPSPLYLGGLCVDPACATIAPDVRAYDTRWHLWSDGAAKRRWIYLPPGTTIDTSQMDYWRFPVGTRLWKEFVRDGVRVETRYMVKTGPGDADWMFTPYAWNAQQTDATPAPMGQQNVNGTGHDIPSVATCVKCHGNTKSRVLGFSAFQLDYAAPSGNVDLDDAKALGWLSAPPAGSSPHFPLPGNSQQQAALGYLHANCGHCHGSQSQLVNKPSFRLEVNYCSTLADTRTYRTAVNVSGQQPYGGATIIAKPGDPAHSIMITRMQSSDPNKRMPWLGGEIADPAGVALIRSWITNL